MTGTLLIGLACGAAPPDGPNPELPPLPTPMAPPSATADLPQLPPALAEPTDGLPTLPAESDDETPGPRPSPLRRPIEPTPDEAETPLPTLPPGFGIARMFRTPIDPPNGFTGRSSVLPTEPQTTPDFVPVFDRWRIGFPEWDRYDKGHPLVDDYPYQLGRLLDPFNQNVLKGDYPIAGQHTFLEVIAKADLLFEGREIPTPASGGFESTARPFSEEFFGRRGQFFTANTFSVTLDLFHGDAGFKPTDWRIVLTPTFNVNTLAVSERAIVSPNVLAGVNRNRGFWTLQQAFVEAKLADLSPDYDFVSIRAGTQPFISDFRGFLFSDMNSGVRLFGSRLANRDQFNVAYFRPREKDTNSGLNTFHDREQDLVFLNYFRQDFLFPGYTAQISFNYNHDPASFKFDKNHFLVRPDPAGIFQPHDVDVAYFGWAGDGHIGRYNISHQFYWAFGRDSLNPLANQVQTINAQMFAIEGSYDRDWARFRSSFFWASGDNNINNSHATGFDTILDQPNFNGGGFSFWNRQQIGLFGVNLVQRQSLVPDLRSSKIQGQANFVNPGLLMPNLGIDFDVTPKLKMINNMNLIWFEHTNVLERFIFDGNIDRFVGFDLSMGFEYRPLLSENVSMIFGVSTLLPGQGFRHLYNNFNDRVDPLVAGFYNLVLVY